ncbi:MAG: histidine kinase dimerization/phosphoacceptor domain -containing protein, partial [Balneolaceae bacterium]|nr:histidine kinase dimerization/phosphoacceptor domain -containing protein [Balneolaceae bacterium]
EMQQKTFEGDLLGSDLLDLLPGKFLILDKEGSFYRVGRSLQQFTGYSEEELRGQPFMELVDVDEREEAGSFIDSVLVSGEQQAELTLIGRKGESLSIILKGGRFQEKGNTFIIGNVFRMSGSDLYNKGYEDATRDHESILKEIHHRIKNNLSIIVTLFEMQKEETEDKNLKWLLTESQNRVKTFALLHEKLYQIGKKSDIPFHHYVQELIDRLGSIYRYKDRVVDLELNTDSFMLSLDKALPFGLLINEILSNAYEHAFTNRSEGVINVEIRQQENRVWARLSDNGKGIKNPEELKQADTLGMTLIKNFLRQLDAKWSMHNGDGLTYELVFEQ